MSNKLNHIVESISGIWANSKYELLLGLNNTFTFEEKKSEEIIDGYYMILQIPGNSYYTLRLTELNGDFHDYDIIDAISFEMLIISKDGERINFKNVPARDYDGESFKPSDN